MVNGWKVIAWIFIILFILETLFLIWAWSYGSTSINNEIKCSNEYCFNADATSYTYDDYTNTCVCYKGEEVIKQVVME